jgi:hypothetical protein
MDVKMYGRRIATALIARNNEFADSVFLDALHDPLIRREELPLLAMLFELLRG